MSTDAHVIAWLRLTRLRGVGPVLVKRLWETLGTAENILAAHPATLAAVEGIGTVKAGQVAASGPASAEWAAAEFDRACQAGITLLPLDDVRYPPALRTIHDPPSVLYVRGELLPADTVALGMVGARRCTLYGREQAQRLGSQLAQSGLTIISGGARGIDTCAHLGALQAGGRTLVVTGCGLWSTYPPENESLYQRIVAEKRGAILSELPLEAPPSAENFPPRNRIIAGMSLGIVVVEANLQSGSLITARLAAADYGREVFALPGRVDSPASAGTHHLIKTAAAHLVESAEDILEHLGDVGRLLQKAEEAGRAEAAGQEQAGLFESAPVAPAPREAVKLTGTQEKLIAAMGERGASMDELVEQSGLPAAVVMAELTLLEIRGVTRRLAENRWGRK